MEPSTQREVFRHQPLNRLVCWIAFLLFGGAFAFATICSLFPIVPDWLAGWEALVVIFGFLGFASFSAFAVWSMSDRIEVDKQSIWWFVPGKAPQRLDWNRLRRMEDRPRMQVLELQGESDDPVIRVNYLLRDFARLRTIIVRHLPKFAALTDEDGLSRLGLPLVFRKPLAAFLLVKIIAVLAVVGFVYYYQQILPELGFQVAVALAVIGLLTTGKVLLDWYSLTVEREQIVLQSFLRVRHIPLVELVSAETQFDETKRFGVTASTQVQLVLHLASGTALRLGGFGNDTHRARDAIRAAKEGLIPG